MKVTKLSSQKKDSSRVNIYIDDEFFCGLSLDSVAKFNLYVGAELNDEELKEILNNELLNRFTQRAMSYISRSLRTEFQLRRYLKDLSIKKKNDWYSEIEKEELEKITDAVISKLGEYGYIDDAMFAEQFVLSRVKNKPRGKMILISELVSKGVSKDMATEKVNEIVEDEYSVLSRVYTKKFKNEKISLQDRKKIDFLRRKGFNWNLIERFINNEPTE